MTTKVLRGTYAAGYSLSSPIMTLSIASSGLIEGQGIHSGSAAAYTVINDGTVDSSSGYAAINLKDGGVIVNGGNHVTTALLISEGPGIIVSGGSGTVTNFGTIMSGFGDGVILNSGGSVTNGSLEDTSAYISSGSFHGGAVGIEGTGTVTNYGGIGFVELQNGMVTNGAVTDTKAVIAGVESYSGTVQNFGTISGGKYVALELVAGGLVVNGSAADITANIGSGPLGGVVLEGASDTLVNFGTILGVFLETSGQITNGSAGDSEAFIYGFIGVSLAGAGVVTNFGTIAVDGIGDEGGGSAVVFSSSADTLIAEANSTFVGVVNAADGRIEVVSGVANFDGGVVTSGTVSGAGDLALTGGTTTFDSGTRLTVADVAVLGAATVVDLDAELDYAGIWTQIAGTLSVAAGDQMTFIGKSNSFAGTLTGAGVIAFDGESDTLEAVTLSAKSQSISASTVSLSGAINLGTKLTVTSHHLIIAASGATLSGGGEFILSNSASNRLEGASASAIFTDNGRITGAGQIGAGFMTLIIGSGGFVDGDQSLALTINTGTRAIANAGKIIAVGAGGTIVKSAVANTGKLYADGGVLTLVGAVTGAGRAYINGGTLDVASTFTENVTFNGTTGVLELAHSQAYTGTLLDFSKTGGTSLDLRDINFVTGTTKATYIGTTKSGTLTVTDGTHTAHIKLSGDYTSSTFNVSAATGGGTQVIDPTAPTSAHAFIAAMAGFAPTASATNLVGSGSGVLTHPMLATPT